MAPAATHGSGGAGAGTAWYRHFWPVFIAVLMAVSIAASLLTVVIAYRHADEEVRSGSPTAPEASEPRDAVGTGDRDRAIGAPR